VQTEWYHLPVEPSTGNLTYLPSQSWFLGLRTDLFNKIAASCFQKCTSAKHREPDLTLGEMTCTDRCVSKYLECQERIGSVLQKANEAQIAQQQNMNEMQQRMK
jgi:mitochondrial import inner membrane translocase subunit TIM10